MHKEIKHSAMLLRYAQYKGVVNLIMVKLCMTG